MRDQTHPPTALSLMRRWVVDYFNSHDPAACADFIAPDYSLHIGDTVFRGRDTEWLPAVDAQMALFPGLTMTVHQTLSGPDWAAAYFSEHGASGGKAAVWSGVAIYRAGQGRLLSCVAQEDYMTRQRQLKSGQADAVEGRGRRRGHREGLRIRQLLASHPVGQVVDALGREKIDETGFGKPQQHIAFLVEAGGEIVKDADGSPAGMSGGVV